MHIAAHKQRPSLHPQERLLASLLGAMLVFLPWAFGTMHGWSQATAFVTALAAFVIALLPRRYDEETSDRGGFRLQMWPRLLRFPLFWLGAGLLVLLVVQGLNPAWQWVRDDKQWWMRQIDHVTWLPHGTQTPFERYNLWRTFLVYATVWLSVCALWVGITRRRALQVLLGVLVANATVLAFVGFVHRMVGETKVLWIREFRDAASFSSFVYQNHAGSYFSLIAAVALGLAIWHFYEGRRRMARSTPGPVWLLAGGVLVFAVLFSFSRGAVITLGAFVIGAGLAIFILRSVNTVPSTTPRAVNVLLALAFLTTLGFMVRYVDFSTLQQRFHEMSKLGVNDPSVVSRIQARDAAWVMLADNWVLGTGAGSFRFLYPIYIKDNPYLYEGGRAFWEHAHIDWLQIPIELGLTGVLLIAAGVGWCLWRWVKGRGWRHPVAVMLFLGCGQTLLHAAIDFPLQCPAVLITWWVLLVAALRWQELDGGMDRV